MARSKFSERLLQVEVVREGDERKDERRVAGALPAVATAGTDDGTWGLAPPLEGSDGLRLVRLVVASVSTALGHRHSNGLL